MELTTKDIQKYQKRSVPWLRKKAGEYFRRWIRKRDDGKPCVSCGAYNTSDASHFYSAGHYPELEFNEDNCWAACKRCNLFLSGNLNEYRKRLIERIGKERVERLDEIAAIAKQTGYKHNRFFLIGIILKYKTL
jgi:5-methylcytosine-specific restriction endonuclease McrA